VDEQMPAIADVAVQVLAEGVPVLFLDTCSILDVIRAPVRGLMDCVEAATELHAMANASPQRCRLVVGSFVPKEWAAHDNDVFAELTKHLGKMQDQASHFHSLSGHLGLSLGFGMPQYVTSGIAAALHDLSRKLLNTSLTIDSHHDTKSRAFDRVAVTKRRPCRKGGELKDCTIFEECLEVCRLLQAGGFAKKMVFCTSNTDDYCAPGVTPHADVAKDCAAVGLLFTTNLSWARSELIT
jgi:hypothetical protein